MDYTAIGKRIRAKRKQKDLSQEELAEMVNISTVHMSHIETGYTKLSLPVLVDIACFPLLPYLGSRKNRAGKLLKGSEVHSVK